MTSRSAPSAVFRAWATSSTPILTLSQSFPYAAASRVKIITLRFYRSAHQRAGPFHACRPLLARTKARDNPALALSSVDHSIGTTSSRTAPPIVGGADGADTDVCPITTVAEDASAAFTIACPATGAAVGMEGDLSCSALVYNNMVAFGYTASITGMAVSICIGGGPICVASACDVTVVPGRDSTTPGATVSTCGVATMTGYATSPVGHPVRALLRLPLRGRCHHRQQNSPNGHHGHPSAPPARRSTDRPLVSQLKGKGLPRRNL
jgi:hypothetical protein